MRDGAEWRTLLAAGACYGLWLLMAFGPFGAPDWLRILLLVPVLTFHSSLQHECMHGHPFRDQRLNDALVWLPIGLLVPYRRFRATHLKHHVNENIADPYDDPESWYLDRAVWRALPGWTQRIFALNNTLVGRIVLGPAIGMVGFVRADLHAWRAGDRTIAADWAAHLAGGALILAAVAAGQGISLAGYLIAAYGGMGLLMVRSFLEHQAHERAGHRSVIIEDRGPFGLLFLNNNLHSVHHAYPSIAWYRLPAFFAKNRERFLKMNGGYRYATYAAIFRAYAFRAKEPVEYPLERRKKPEI